MTETEVMREVRLYLGQQPDLVIHRNNVGTAIHVNDKGATMPVKYGLCEGSADLIGILKPNGRYLAFECKSTKGRVAPEQEQFLRLIRRMGGFACVVRSVRDASDALNRAREGAQQ